MNSLVLGTGDVSPLDMAVGFSTFANRGVHNDPDIIAKIEQVDEDGDVTVLEQARPTDERVLTEQEADLVTYALRQVVTAAPARGQLRQGRRRARPAPPRTTATPGSSASRPSSPPRCGWATPTRRPRTEAPPTEDAATSTASEVTGGVVPGADLEQVHAQRHGGDRAGLVRPRPSSFPGQGPQPGPRAQRRRPRRPRAAPIPGDGGSSTSTSTHGARTRPSRRHHAPTDHDHQPLPPVPAADRPDLDPTVPDCGCTA